MLSVWSKFLRRGEHNENCKIRTLMSQSQAVWWWILYQDGSDVCGVNCRTRACYKIVYCIDPWYWLAHYCRFSKVLLWIRFSNSVHLADLSHVFVMYLASAHELSQRDILLYYFYLLLLVVLNVKALFILSFNCRKTCLRKKLKILLSFWFYETELDPCDPYSLIQYVCSFNCVTF